MTDRSIEMSATSRKNESRPPKLIAFGNPLLDMSVEINNNQILELFDLNPDDQKEIPMEKLSRIITVASATYGAPQYNPGGSSLNTCRILQTLGEKNILFCGSVGDDKNGEILKSILRNSSVNCCLQTVNDYQTGTCLCLVNGEQRSLVANIGAALHFKKEFVQSKWCISKIKSKYCNEDNPQIFYVEGFFVPEKLSVCEYIYENYCKYSNNMFAVNLSAPYILKKYTKEMIFMTEKADIIFGNRREFETLAILFGHNSVEETAKFLIKKYTKQDSSKIIVMTDGSEAVYLYYGTNMDFHEEIFEVPSIEKELIIDTTGAGDSFVAGFLFHYLSRVTSLMQSVVFASKVASKVIQQVGCNLQPSFPTSASSSYACVLN